MPRARPAPTIVTAHSNADFDALAAMVAASKLYPGAVLVFPGSQEKNLRNFFIESATYLFNFVAAKDIDPDTVRNVVLVDTRQYSRLEHIRHILDAAPERGLTIHAYDHHPDSDEDVPYSEGLVTALGSTTTILIGLLRDRGVDLTPDEATILALGVYEDTGSFTFNSTTPEDFLAGAWLRRQGMDLNAVSELLQREMTAEQVAVLNELLESAQTHDINGVQVVVAQVTLDYYLGDFALLAHKLMDMENIRVLFAVGRMDDRIQVVARSRTPDVDVGHICSSLGGGGHSYAASASVKDRTLPQVRDELFALLYSHVNPQVHVAELMSSPPVVIEDAATMAEAMELMTRYGLKSLPVVEQGGMRCAGVLDHVTVDKAHAHGLGGEPVSEYMRRNCAVINPASDIYPIMELIGQNRQRLVPVVQDGNVVGVVSRTDIINRLIEEPARIPEALKPDKRHERNLRRHMKDGLPAPMHQRLALAGELAADMGYNVYAVGGFVRDLLLQRSNLDLDLVVEGDGIAYARALAEKLGGRVRSHAKFQTAVVILEEDGGDTDHIDVATARLEYYEHPAALPTVELSSIKMDLLRRDFTINALAVELNPGRFGRLADFFGGQRDLKDRLIRVLHSLSFVEDPTRMLRAVRFEQRFVFKIGPQTDRLVKNALKLKLMDRLSGARIMNELILIMQEERPLSCLRRMEQFGMLGAIHPLLTLSRKKEATLENVEKVLSWYLLLYLEPKPEPWRLYFLGLCTGATEEEVKGLLDRLNLSKKAAHEFVTLRQSYKDASYHLRHWARRSAKSETKWSELYAFLETIPVEGVLYLMARSNREDMRKHISLFLTKMRDVELAVTGDDVMGLGVPPGPEVGAILRELMAERLDGRAYDRAAQLEAARVMAAKRGYPERPAAGGWTPSAD